MIKLYAKGRGKMKTAVKVLSVLGIIFIGIALLVMFILTINIKALIDYSYESGTLMFNGRAASATEAETIKNIFTGIFISLDVVLLISTILPIINLVTADSDSKVLHLVLGILDIVLCAFIIVGIVQILIYVGVDEKVEKNSSTIEY